MTAPTEPSKPRPSSARTKLQLAIALGTMGLLVVGLYRAWALRWACDDAYISYRYADNLVAGHGLVWNAGERVEGFTNLLWTLLLAAASALDLDLVWTSEVLGVASLAVVVLASWRLAARWSSVGVVIPVAAWLLLLMEDVLVWTTGGLETMTAAALATVMALLLFGGEHTSAKRELAAGVVGALLALTRADGALLSGVMALGYVVVRWPGVRPALWHAARTMGPILAAVVGNVVFRVAYYGDWLPNTYYAKSADVSYWDQGFWYVALLAARNHVLIWLVIIALGMEVVERRAAKRGIVLGGEPADRASAVLAVTGLAFVMYVARSGGDFMFARRLIPVLPLFLLAFGRLLERFRSVKWQLGLSLGLAVATALPVPIFEWWGQIHRLRGVTDERAYYQEEAVAIRRAQGEALARAFAGIDTHFLLDGGLCMLAYYSGLPRFMEGNGLTNREIARQEVKKRGFVGHEKPPPEWLLDREKVAFVVMQARPTRSNVVDIVSIENGLLYLRILYWDAEVMAQLRERPGVRFLSIEAALWGVRQKLRRGSCDDARWALYRVDQYYLRWHAPDSDERRELHALADERCPRESQ